MMKVFVGEASGSPLGEVGFSFVATAHELDAAADGFAFLGDIAVKGQARHTGTCYRVTGVINCRKSFVCDRCLKPCEEDQSYEFSEDFYRAGDEAAAEDAPLFSGDCLDVAPLVRDVLLSAQPLSHLCRPDCLGLCHVCGADLNEGDCGCGRQSVDPRLAALEKFKSQ